MATRSVSDLTWSYKDNPLATRMKNYEKAPEVGGIIKLNPDCPYIIRLDGHRFSKFTKGFNKPFDERIYLAMLYTTCDLLHEFQPSVAYTQSDEITLVYPTLKSKENEDPQGALMFSGRIQKTITLISGFCSVRFAYHLSKQPLDEKQKAKVFRSFFDARVFQLPSYEEVAYNIIWRISDVKCNSINNLAHQHFKQNEVEGKDPKKVLNMLESKGIKWENMPNPYKYGIFVKKTQFVKPARNLKTGEEVLALRSLVSVGSLDSSQIMNVESENVVKLWTEKYTNNCGEFHNIFVPVENYKEE